MFQRHGPAMRPDGGKWHRIVTAPPTDAQTAASLAWPPNLKQDWEVRRSHGQQRHAARGDHRGTRVAARRAGTGSLERGAAEAPRGTGTEILVLERKLEIQDEAAASAKESTAIVSAGPKGFSLRSADGKNQLRLRGTLHLDGRYLRRRRRRRASTPSRRPACARPSRARFGGIYDFRFMPDFGQGRTVIQDAYVTARFHPAAQLTVGKFKSPVGLERLQCSRATSAGSSAPSRRRWCRTATSACSSAATSGAGRLLVPGGLPERLERRRRAARPSRDVGRQRRQGIRAAPVLASVRGERQLRAARPRHRHRRHLHGPGRQRDAAAAAVVPLRRARRRSSATAQPARRPGRSRTASARASRRSSTTMPAASA